MKLQDLFENDEQPQKATYVERDLSYLDARRAAYEYRADPSLHLIYSDRTNLWYLIKFFPGIPLDKFLNTTSEINAIQASRKYEPVV